MALGSLQCIKKCTNFIKISKKITIMLKTLLKTHKYKTDYKTCKYLSDIALQDILKC